MNLLAKQKETLRKPMCGCQGKRLSWCLERSCTHRYIYKGQPARTYCIAQGTLLNVTCQAGWEGSLGENGPMYD